MTIRFIHTGDKHFTNNFPYSRMNPKTGLNERFEEQLAVERFICDYAVKNKIKYVLNAGDTFHWYNPTTRVRSEYAKIISEYPSLEHIVCGGNHDTCGKWFSLQDISYLNPERFRFFHTPESFILEGVQVDVIPWGYPVNTFKTPMGNTKILLTHQSITGAKYDNEFISKDGVSIKDLQSLNYNYVALGHFHTMQKLASGIYYSGSIYPRDFKDLGRDKYFLDVTITDNGSVIVNPVVCCSNKFLHITAVDDLEHGEAQGKIIKLTTKQQNSKQEVEELYSLGAQWVIVDHSKESYKNKLDDIKVDLSITDAIKDYVKENNIKDKLVSDQALSLIKDIDKIEYKYGSGIELLKIEFENMFSYEKARVDFSSFHSGIILIEGINNGNTLDSNGAGKSSFLPESLNWVLFDKTIDDSAKDKDSVIRLGCEKCYCYLKFKTSNGDIIEIYKEKKRGKAPDFQIKVNGDPKAVVKKTRTLYIEWIASLIGISFDIWRNSIVLGQGDKNGLLFGTDKGRKDLIGSALGFSMLDKVLDKIRTESLRNNERELTTVRDNIRFIQDKKIAYKTKEEYTELIDDAKHEIHVANKVLDKLSIDINVMLEKKKLADKKEILQVEYDNASNSLVVLKTSYKEFIEKKRNKIIEIEVEIEKVVLQDMPGETSNKKVKIAQDIIVDFDVEIGKKDVSINKLNEEISSISTIMFLKASDKKKALEKIVALQVGDNPECPYCGQIVSGDCIGYFRKIEKDLGLETISLELKKSSCNNTKDNVLIEKQNAQKEVVKYRSWVEDYKWKLSKEKEIITLSEAIDEKKASTKSQRTMYTQQIEKCGAQLIEISIDFNAVEYQRLLANQINSKKLLNYLIQSKANYNSKMKVIEGFIKDEKDLLRQEQQINIEYTRNKILERIFGQQGIRVKMLVNVIPFIEQCVNKYLSEIDMSYYKVALDIIDDKFDINVLDDNVARSITTYSGGEKKLFTVLFNLALGEMISNQKTGFGFAIMDEVTDELDVLHNQYIIDLLLNRTKDKNQKLFLTTHRSDTKITLESHGVQKIVIRKQNKRSIIE